jgi:hypothetical protein
MKSGKDPEKENSLRYAGRIAALLLTLGVGLIGAASSASAAPALLKPAISSVTCDSFITGNTGMASCSGGLYGGSAQIVVICNAWWDPNVTSDWIYVSPGRRIGSADGLKGYCYSGVESVSTNTR